MKRKKVFRLFLPFSTNLHASIRLRRFRHVFYASESMIPCSPVILIILDNPVVHRNAPRRVVPVLMNGCFTFLLPR